MYNHFRHHTSNWGIAHIHTHGCNPHDDFVELDKTMGYRKMDAGAKLSSDGIRKLFPWMLRALLGFQCSPMESVS